MEAKMATVLFVIAVALFVVGAIAAFLAAFENTPGQVWLKLLAGLGGALAAAIAILIVFGLLWATWSLLTGTVISPQEAKAPVVNVNVPQQPAPVVNVQVPTQQAPVINVQVPTQVPPIINVIVPTPVPTAAPAVPIPQPATDRVKRLVELDKIYRNQGLEPWLHAAGFTWEGAVQQARQVEEETVVIDGLPKIVASGVQLKATNFHAAYPGCFTTDRPYVLDPNGRSHKPDPNNPSVLVTNGKVSDTLTAYVDCSNWSQLTPR